MNKLIIEEEYEDLTERYSRTVYEMGGMIRIEPQDGWDLEVEIDEDFPWESMGR